MRIILTILISCVFINSAYAECPSATKWAKAFYTQHYDFYYSDPLNVKQLVTPAFFELLQLDAAYSSNHTEIGALDYDPWLGTQDGKMGKPLAFKIKSQSPNATMISMSYPFLIETGRSPTMHTVVLILQTSGQNCWQLHDFITPTDTSLSQLYSSIKL